MQINVKTSAKGQERINTLTRILPGNINSKNVIARIAMMASLASGKRFDVQEAGKYDAQGMEYKDNTLFSTGIYRDAYIATFCQAYGVGKEDERLPKYIKLHLEDGLELIEHRVEGDGRSEKMFNWIAELLERGMENLMDKGDVPSMIPNQNLHVSKAGYGGRINLKIGESLDGEEIRMAWNDTEKHQNPHIAVAGGSGSGKTEFAKELIRQIHRESRGKVNCLFLDFKGLGKDGVEKMRGFFHETEMRLVQPPSESFPINPLLFIDNVNENNRNLGIRKFADIIEKNSSLGTVQKAQLRGALKDAYGRHKDGKIPTIEEVFENVMAKKGEDRDSLTEVLESLCEAKIFDPTQGKQAEFLNKNYYLSLPAGVDKTIRYTAVHLILNCIYNILLNMGNANIENGVMEMRYVVMIDEAHELFSQPKIAELLEDMLRKVRSFGVGIILLSQGVKEYEKKDFDFSSQCETAFLLKMKDFPDTKKCKSFLGIEIKNETRNKMSDAGSGVAVGNLKEGEAGNIIRLAQYYKEK